MDKDIKKDLLAQIQLENDRMSKARKLLLDGNIDAGDYKLIKQECENKLNSLEAKLMGYNQPSINIDECVEKAIAWLSSIDVIYNQSDAAQKRSMIGSIYPEKLCFDGNTYRTARINEAAQLMWLINKKIGAKKIGQNLIFQACPIR